MAKVCELTGRRTSTGNNVSHSKRHTKRKFFLNLHTRRLYSEILKKDFPLRVSNRAVRTVLFKKGLDNFLLGHNNIKAKNNFSLSVLRLYKLLKKKVEKYKA